MLNRAKIIVSGYPQTVFTEFVHSGKPVILLYYKEFWEHEVLFDEVVQSLQSASILFDCSYAAAKHIDKVFENPLLWWEHPKTKKARDLFFDFCAGKTHNGVDKWVSFLESHRLYKKKRE